MMSAALASPAPSAAPRRTEAVFRGALWGVTLLTILALLISCAIAFWAQNDFSAAESVVTAQSLMLAHDGTLYYHLNQYPYTVAGYMPIFYFLDAGLIRLGLPAFASGRILTMLAFFLLIATCWRLALLYTGDRTIAWIAALLVACNPLMFLWSEVGQVDIVAVSFATLAFYFFSRYWVRGDTTIPQTALFALLALFTKQTMLAAPAAIFFLLLLRDVKKALIFIGVVGGLGGALVLGLNAGLGGRLLEDTVRGNMNPLSGWKFKVQLEYLLMISGCLILTVGVSVRRLIRGRTFGLCIYTACTILIFLATCGKVGSDTNYQLEMTVALATCAAIGLHRLDFLSLYFARSKCWVTLLVLPLAIHFVDGFRTVPGLIVSRIGDELAARERLEQLRPYVPASGGLVFSSDYDSVVRLRQRLDIEPLIYGLLVRGGAVNPGPVQRDLSRGAFSAVILTEDVAKPEQTSFLEITVLPEGQREAIREHYRLVKHIPGPFQHELFVYQPIR